MANKRIYELAEDATPAAADFLMTDISGAGAALKVNLNKFVLASGTVDGAVSQAQTFGAAGVKIAYDANNYATATVAATGALTVTTLGAGAADSHIALMPDGFVGVGALVPGDNLDVVGGITISGTSGFSASKNRIYNNAANGLIISADATGSTYDFVILGSTSNIQIANPTATNNLVLNPTSGNVGIAAVIATNLLSLGGNAARIIWMERHLTADTAGNTLTITAGGATAAATDKAGGALILQGGLSTGSAESGVTIRGCVAGASGTTDRTQTTAIQVLGNKIGLFSATPVVKQTGYAVPIDLTTCISALTALRTALINYGLMTTV